MVQTSDTSAKKKNWFIAFAQATSAWAGSQTAFILAFGMIVVWGLSGPIFHYSDTWQMVINTGTTIITFLMVFLIQNSQNRDGRVIQLKLDELIRAVEGAENAMINMEEMTEDELQAMQLRFARMAEKARRAAETRSGHQPQSASQVAPETREARRSTRKKTPATHATSKIRQAAE